MERGPRAFRGGAPSLLLTATPERRDGRPIPGSLEYYYPLRRALDEGLYKPIEPVLLPAPAAKRECDEAIATRAVALLAEDKIGTSVLLVRAGTISRLGELQEIYELHVAIHRRPPRRNFPAFVSDWVSI